MPLAAIFIEIFKAIAAPLAVLGVGWMTYVGVAKQLSAHAERERKQREHEMHRAAHFEMGESINRFYLGLRRHCSVTISDVELQTLMLGYGNASVKMHLVGSVEAIENLSRFDKVFAAALFVLTPMRVRLLNLKENYDRKISQIIEINNHIKNLNFSGDPRAVTDYEKLTNISSASGKDGSDFWRQMGDLALEMSTIAQTHISSLSEAQIDGVKIARKALFPEESFDWEKYRLQASLHNHELNQAYEAYLMTLGSKGDPLKVSALS